MLHCEDWVSLSRVPSWARHYPAVVRLDAWLIRFRQNRKPGDTLELYGAQSVATGLLCRVQSGQRPDARPTGNREH